MLTQVSSPIALRVLERGMIFMAWDIKVQVRSLSRREIVKKPEVIGHIVLSSVSFVQTLKSCRCSGHGSPHLSSTLLKEYQLS